MRSGLVLSLFSQLAPCSSSLFGRLYDMTQAWVAGDEGNFDVIDSKSSPINNSIVFRDVAAVDYAAEMLQFLFQHNMADFDDSLAVSQYQRQNRGKKPPANFWRSSPVTILCKPDGSRGVNSSGYITCEAMLAEKGREPIKATFAKYYMIPQDLVTGKFSEKKESTFSRHAADLQEMAAALNKIAELCPLKALFESCSMERRKFSPFHPDKAIFDLQVRMPMPDSMHGEEAEVLCRLTLLSDSSGGCNIHQLTKNHPQLIYRLLYDPQNPFPSGAPVMIDPLASLNTGEHVKRYATDTAEFLAEWVNNLATCKWQVKFQDSSIFDRDLARRMVDSVIELVDDLAKGRSCVQTLDCTRPLAYRTGSSLAPPTTSVFGLDLFNRVHVGKVPGLWLVIRGQNSGEALVSQYVSMPVDMQTTKEFKTWRPSEDDDLSWAKYYIHNGAKGLFVIFFWNDDQANNDDRANRARAPLQHSGASSGRVAIKRQSHESTSPSPSLKAPVTETGLSLEQTGVTTPGRRAGRTYSDGGTQQPEPQQQRPALQARRVNRHVVSIVQDDSGEISLEDQINLRASQNIEPSPNNGVKIAMRHEHVAPAQVETVPIQDSACGFSDVNSSDNEWRSF